MLSWHMPCRLRPGNLFWFVWYLLWVRWFLPACKYWCWSTSESCRPPLLDSFIAASFSSAVSSVWLPFYLPGWLMELVSGFSQNYFSSSYNLQISNSPHDLVNMDPQKTGRWNCRTCCSAAAMISFDLETLVYHRLIPPMLTWKALDLSATLLEY